MLQVRFTTLKLDEIYSLIRLLGCCGISTCMLQPQDLQPEVPGASLLPEGMTSFVGLAKTLAEEAFKKPVDLPSGVPDTSIEDFALADGMKLRQVNVADIEKYTSEFNDMAHCIARVNVGLVARDVTNRIELHIKKYAEQLPADIISPSICAVVSRLREDDKTLTQLLDGDPERRRLRLVQLRDKLDKYHGTVTSMNVCAAQLDLGKISGLASVEKHQASLGRVTAAMGPPGAGRQISEGADQHSTQGAHHFPVVSSDDEWEASDVCDQLCLPPHGLHARRQGLERQYLDRIRTLEEAVRNQGQDTSELQHLNDSLQSKLERVQRELERVQREKSALVAQLAEERQASIPEKVLV